MAFARPIVLYKRREWWFPGARWSAEGHCPLTLHHQLDPQESLDWVGPSRMNNRLTPHEFSSDQPCVVDPLFEARDIRLQAQRGEVMRPSPGDSTPLDFRALMPSTPRWGNPWRWEPGATDRCPLALTYKLAMGDRAVDILTQQRTPRPVHGRLDGHRRRPHRRPWPQRFAKYFSTPETKNPTTRAGPPWARTLPASAAQARSSGISNAAHHQGRSARVCARFLDLPKHRQPPFRGHGFGQAHRQAVAKSRVGEILERARPKQATPPAQHDRPERLKRPRQEANGAETTPSCAGVTP